MTLAQAQALIPGSTLVGDGATAVGRVHSDTRTLQPGDLFVALRGERFDGNDYLSAAKAAGAVAAIAERGLAIEVGGMPGLLVGDALAALQTLSAAWRAQFQLPLVAVTGSNGKTTVTQMVAAILRAWLGEAALATAGNFNNHIGVPLTLLRLRAAHRAAVLELGMNHPGEIALLANLARPTVALVNNAQREHLEFMSSVEAVARENGSVIAALGADGTVVVPAADAHTPLWREMAGTRKLCTFGLQNGDPHTHVWADAKWQAEDNHWALQLYTPIGGADTTLALAGLHNVANAAAAAACAIAAGAPLAAVALGLANFEAVSGRSQAQRLQLQGRAVTLVNDSYNANPDSVLAAIAVLAALPGPRWLVLGDMGEVGNEGPRFHAEVGAAAKAAGIEHFWAAGALCAHAGAHRHFDTVAALLEALAQETPAAASVLVKGSRFMKMEQVVRALQAQAAPSSTPQTTANAGAVRAA
jgi:UDP-N-acetylmuramoyl-tripeptide--D-alanyl-D-alanine ligase